LINRNYAVAYLYLGYAFEQSGDMDNANKVYDYIKKQFPGGADAINTVRNGQVAQPAPTTPSTTTTSTDTSKLPT
jgi:hypothetical protein